MSAVTKAASAYVTNSDSGIAAGRTRIHVRSVAFASWRHEIAMGTTFSSNTVIPPLY
jgi:hypothetical protein